MDVEELQWLPANEEKLRTHSLSREAVDGMIRSEEWVIYRTNTYPEQVRLVGPTPPGMLITVVLDPTDDPRVWRPVTGWPSTDWETAYYWDEYR